MVTLFQRPHKLTCLLDSLLLQTQFPDDLSNVRCIVFHCRGQSMAFSVRIPVSSFTMTHWWNTHNRCPSYQRPEQSSDKVWCYSLFKHTHISWIFQSYLIFVIFFTQAKLFENKIYTKKTRKLRPNTK